MGPGFSFGNIFSFFRFVSLEYSIVTSCSANGSITSRRGVLRERENYLRSGSFHRKESGTFPSKDALIRKGTFKVIRRS